VRVTQFGWDASHYDGLLSTTILSRAKAEGIVFFTHKIGEGLTDTEAGHDDTALAAARDAGIECLAGYLVPRTLDAAAQVDFWLKLADTGEPWWRDWPLWAWQVDLERWTYDNVAAAKGIDCARRLRDRTGRPVLLYASHGQYWDELQGWDGPLWNADYAARSAAGFAAMYPGDDWTPLHNTWRGGWAPYSGKTPTILQYTSSATIAGLTTCDANAFRGTYDQLKDLFRGETDVSQDYASLDMRNFTQPAWMTGDIAAVDTASVLRTGDQTGWSPRDGGGWFITRTLRALVAAAAADETRDAATLAAINALAEVIRSGGGDVNVTAVLAAIDDAVKDVKATVEQRHAEEMMALNQAHAAEIAGLKAELDALSN
jgi:hypothetical protein